MRERLVRCEGEDVNSALTSVFEATDALMAVEDGVGVLLRIARSPDLMHRLAARLGRGDAGLTITLFRSPPYSLSSCFRVFVCNRKITAVTQLFHLLVFPQLCVEANRAVYEKRVCDFVQQQLRDIGKDSVVVDVALTKAGPGIVLDVHAFDDSTDALLFNWVVDGRRLCEGPVELRACSRTPRIIPFGFVYVCV
jgi:hypothetical protein